MSTIYNSSAESQLFKEIGPFDYITSGQVECYIESSKLIGVDINIEIGDLKYFGTIAELLEELDEKLLDRRLNTISELVEHEKILKEYGL